MRPETVLGALALFSGFSSVVLLFWYILQIMMSFASSD